MNTTPVGGGANPTKLTIEGYLDVLAKLKPCPYSANVEYHGGPIYISHAEKPGIKMSPLSVVYEQVTGKVLYNRAAFYIPEVLVDLGMSSSDVLAIRYAEMGLRAVGGNLFEGFSLRENILKKLSVLLVLGGFRCFLEGETDDFYRQFLTPAA